MPRVLIRDAHSRYMGDGLQAALDLLEQAPTSGSGHGEKPSCAE